MSAGYEIVDRLASHREASQRGNCGGPDGYTGAARIAQKRQSG
jgi:hypothetical protein